MTSAAAMKPSELRSSLLESYGLPSHLSLHENTAEMFAEDVARAVIWALHARGEPAHPRAARSRIESVLQSNPFIARSDGLPGEDIVSATLQRLCEVGDFETVGAGRYAPVPLRLVPIAESEALLSGGIPSHLLPDRIRQQLVPSGSCRMVSMSMDILKQSLPNVPVQSLSGWLARPRVNALDLLDFWLNAQTIPAPQGNILANAKIYAPEIVDSDRARTSQRQRWVDPRMVRANGRYLIEFQPVNQRFQYRIAIVDQGRISRTSDWTIKKDMAHRLRFEIDRRASRPLLVESPSPRRIKLGSSLPVAETRLLTATARRVHFPENERDYPQVWHFPNARTMLTWKSIAEALGIEIASHGSNGVDLKRSSR